MNETMVTVTGNVAGDVIARRVGANLEHMLVTFRVASSERRWDKASESWVDGDRFTASVNCWRRLADGARCLTKGDPVIVTGRLSVREYEAEGVRRYMTEISAVAVGPDLARCTADVHRRRPDGAQAAEGAVTEGAVTEGDGLAGPAGLGEGTSDVVPAFATVPSSEATLVTEGAPEVASVVDGPESEGATVTGITPGDRRRSGSSRASA
ncbi:single-stranded DNA-binding protein [Actinomycetospora callitridis]|uniref:single-stranded DNA-binding protein n=1 Tax=Actinomycetospora callitridis TaxID=913944 RepID=UPI0023661461|nr:single-stranded DNA-binding protein [Actinomycetospora callitridis]MDD7919439.1 single-stranded DNA-binding protein [Actinomycetospora callitridis]